MLPSNQVESKVRVLNLTDKPIHLKEDLCLGSAEPAIMVGSIRTRDSDEAYSSIYTTCDGNMPPTVGASDLPPTGGVSNPNPSVKRLYGNDRVDNSDDAHMRSLYNDVKETLPNEEAEVAVRLLKQFDDKFSRSEFDFDRSYALSHRIDTGDKCLN
jgi:hypothetical protein